MVVDVVKKRERALASPRVELEREDDMVDAFGVTRGANVGVAVQRIAIDVQQNRRAMRGHRIWRVGELRLRPFYAARSEVVGKRPGAAEDDERIRRKLPGDQRASTAVRRVGVVVGCGGLVLVTREAAEISRAGVMAELLFFYRSAERRALE